ncbi:MULTISPECIES: sunset domain-containing protein [unclassified Isoptericola]|uniref:sunset domain-containing protein n=1 Tax=Isoptericola sp. NPDC057191 TaxID=3346041 RepID=UPI00362A2570
MKQTSPARRGGRLAAIVTTVTLLAAPLAVVPATLAAPTAAAVTTQVTIKKIGTKTAPYQRKVTVRPRVSATGHVSVRSKTLTVKKSGTTVAKNKKAVALKAGTYRVTTRVAYKTYRLTSSRAKVWSATKVRTKTQTLLVRQGKKPSRTTPVSEYNCPSWAPIKGNQTTSHSTDWIYHVPGGRYYKVTKPEECFTTEAAARNAGYRKSKL